MEFIGCVNIPSFKSTNPFGRCTFFIPPSSEVLMWWLELCCVSPQLLRCVQVFATPWTKAQQALLSLEFSRQEYWSTLPLPAPGDLPHPGTEPSSPHLLALLGRFFTLRHLGSLMAGVTMTILQSHSELEDGNQPRGWWQERQKEPESRRNLWNYHGCVLSRSSCVWLFAILWTVVPQASLTMGLSRQEYWSGLHAFLQGIFWAQESNPGLLHCRQILYWMSSGESPILPTFRLEVRK